MVQLDQVGDQSQLKLQSQFVYDPVGRLKQQLARHVAKSDTPVAHNAIDRAYEYDQVGNLLSIKTPQGDTHYRYDNLGRISAAEQNGSTERFAFDPAHNLLNGEDKPLSDNRVSVFEDKRYTYDAHGNLINKKIGAHTEIELFWNAEHQLVASKTARHGSQQQTQYRYDPFGRRIAKQDSFGISHFIWDGNRLLQEQRNSLQRTWFYNGESFVPLAQIDQVGDQSQLLYFHTDHLGPPRELSDVNGDIQWRASYKAWGNVLRVECAQDEQASSPNEQLQALRFQGQYYDNETGLHYNRFRYYDPDIGRFISQDPIGLLGGNNLYQYAANPSGWVDPLGLAGNPATATHITYQGIDALTGKPYIGYASMQGDQLGVNVLKYRYGGDFSRFDGNAPQVLFEGYGQGGKDIARGLEQRTFEDLGGLKGTANVQNPVGQGNVRRDIYLDAADKHRAGSSCSC